MKVKKIRSCCTTQPEGQDSAVLSLILRHAANQLKVKRHSTPETKGCTQLSRGQTGRNLHGQQYQRIADSVRRFPFAEAREFLVLTKQQSQGQKINRDLTL